MVLTAELPRPKRKWAYVLGIDRAMMINHYKNQINKINLIKELQTTYFSVKSTSYEI